MSFLTAYATNVGIRKSVNQDSLCIKVADTSIGQIVMLVVCDGMGGLEKGELASAEVIKSLSNWFDNELPHKYKDITLQSIADEIVSIAEEENRRIVGFGKETGITIGTTMTMFLSMNGEYVFVHVGDTRVYRITEELDQLTKDQTFVAREIERGTMTPEQAETDKRRNMLLQCIGASSSVEPEVGFGKLTNNSTIMLCSDGFRHVLTNEEIISSFEPNALIDEKQMEDKCNEMIDLVMERKERDNITVLLLKVE